MTEEQEKQESQKTLVAFVAGLLIGGLLVWVFGGSPQTDTTEMNGDTKVESSEEMSDEGATSEGEIDVSASAIEATTNEVPAPAMEVGEGEINVTNQAAGLLVELESATFPTSEGWIGVRTFPNGQIGSILGVARYSEEQGLIPTEVELLAPTVAGRTYAVVFFTEDGDRKFDPAYDVQMDSALTTFVAQ